MIHDPNFSIEMGDDWEAIPVDLEAFYGFTHTEKDLVAVFSSQSFRALHRDLDEMAEVVANMGNARMASDHARFGQATIYEPIIAPQPWGRAIVCLGHDRSGRQSIFSAMLTPVCFITLHTLSDAMTEAELVAETDDLVARLDFNRTPVEAYAAFH